MFSSCTRKHATPTHAHTHIFCSPDCPYSLLVFLSNVPWWKSMHIHTYLHITQWFISKTYFQRSSIVLLLLSLVITIIAQDTSNDNANSDSGSSTDTLTYVALGVAGFASIIALLSITVLCCKHCKSTPQRDGWKTKVKPHRQEVSTHWVGAVWSSVHPHCAAS